MTQSVTDRFLGGRMNWGAIVWKNGKSLNPGSSELSKQKSQQAWTAVESLVLVQLSLRL